MEPWKRLFLALLGALHEAIGVTTATSPPSLYHHLLSLQLDPQTKQDVLSMIRKCLEHIQNDDSRVDDRPVWLYLRRDFDAKYSAFEDHFFGTLGTIYFALQYPRWDKKEEKKFLRLRKLGVLGEVCRALTTLDCNPNTAVAAHAAQEDQDDILPDIISLFDSYADLEPLRELSLRDNPSTLGSSCEEADERRRKMLEAVTERLERQHARGTTKHPRPDLCFRMRSRILAS